MSLAQIITAWISADDGDGATHYMTDAASRFALVKIEDCTGQDASAIASGLKPNLVTMDVEASDSVLDDMEADSNIEVVWRE